MTPWEFYTLAVDIAGLVPWTVVTGKDRKGNEITVPYTEFVSQLGMDGWELVAAVPADQASHGTVVTILLFFKRPLPAECYGRGSQVQSGTDIK
jgi:hypothetical protein